jgi:hypothetical protein
MSLAHQIAQTAHEQALAAAAMEALHEEALNEDMARTEAARHKAAFEAALPVLNDWFPGVHWDYQAAGPYDRDTIITEAGAEWNDPLKIKADCWLIDMNEGPSAGYRLQLKCVVLTDDTSMPGYSYWSGQVVKSAADVGRWLAARE